VNRKRRKKKREGCFNDREKKIADQKERKSSTEERRKGVVAHSKEGRGLRGGDARKPVPKQRGERRAIRERERGRQAPPPVIEELSHNKGEMASASPPRRKKKKKRSNFSVADREKKKTASPVKKGKEVRIYISALLRDRKRGKKKREKEGRVLGSPRTGNGPYVKRGEEEEIVCACY